MAFESRENEEAAKRQPGAREVVFWRHGRTEWNATKRLQGQTDVPLDDIGLAQVRAAAATLARLYPTARVLTSPLDRAAVTAAEFASLTGAQVVPDQRVAERSFGDWEGLRAEEIEEGWPQGYAEWKLGIVEFGASPPGGETRAQTAARVLAAVLEQVNAAECGQVLLVVSHGAAISATITAMLGEDPATWRGLQGIDNAHWSRLRRAGPGQNPPWRLAAHNTGA